MRCEQVFRQVCWLAERFWPDVDGMGEEDETSGRTLSLAGQSAQNGAVQAARAAAEVVGEGFALSGGDAGAGTNA